MNRLEILTAVYGNTEWSEVTLSSIMRVIELSQAEARKQIVASIIDNFVVQHEAANGRHNYWLVAANLVKAEYGE